MSSLTIERLAWTGGIVVAVVVLRYLVTRAACRRLADEQLIFRTRKLSTYVATVAVIVAVAIIWSDSTDNVATAVALLSAGIAIALGDVFLNLAGWLYIVVRRPFRIGDRVEIDGHAGDVIDTRVLRFSLLEIRNWVDADQYTGRIVHIPNGRLFRTSAANYTEGFHYIWHEVPVLVTFESDWKRAEEIVAAAIAPEAADARAMGAPEELQHAARDYFLANVSPEPETHVSVRDSGVLVTGRALIEARRRRHADSAVWRRILDAVEAEPSVDFAYPTVRVTDPGDG